MCDNLPSLAEVKLRSQVSYSHWTPTNHTAAQCNAIWQGGEHRFIASLGQKDFARSFKRNGLNEFPDHAHMMEDDAAPTIPAHSPQNKYMSNKGDVLSLGSKSVSPCQAF